MKPYSKDLRQKIIDTYLEGQESIRQIAQRFKVSKSFVQKLLKQYRQTKIVAPKPRRGGQLPKLNSKQISLVAELVEQNNDATLQELCNMLENQIGVRVSRSTMSRIVRKLKSS
ncbi:transposase [Pleurocapsales cyanobacterium LEGE 06147]|nr:transposase [Pleurocapsales cyanobacterium LEGE 06147]